jgi:hypothetical protein
MFGSFFDGLAGNGLTGNTSMVDLNGFDLGANQRAYADSLANINLAGLNEGEMNAINNGFRSSGNSQFNLLQNKDNQFGSGLSYSPNQGGSNFWSARGGASLIPGLASSAIGLAALPGQLEAQRKANQYASKRNNAADMANEKTKLHNQSLVDSGAYDTRKTTI